METRTLSRREARFARRRRPSTLTIPSGVSPHVRVVFTEMQRQGVTYDRVEELSGVLRATVKAWRHKNKPGLESIEAVLGCLGWDFVPIPRAKVLPKALVDDLAPIAERHELAIGKTLEALVALVAKVHETFPYQEAPPPPPPPIRQKGRGRPRKVPPAPSTAPSAAEIAAPL